MNRMKNLEMMTSLAILLMVCINSISSVSALKPLITFKPRDGATSDTDTAEDELWIPEILTTWGTLVLSAVLNISERLVDLRFSLLDPLLSGPSQSVLLEALLWTVLYFLYAKHMTQRLALHWLPHHFPVFWNNNPHPSLLVSTVNHHQGLVCSTVQDDAVVLLTWAGHHAVAGTLCFWGWLLSDEVPNAHQLCRHGALIMVGLWLSNLFVCSVRILVDAIPRHNKHTMNPAFSSFLYHPFCRRATDGRDPLKPGARTMMILHHLGGLLVLARYADHVQGLVVFLMAVATMNHLGYIYAHLMRATRGPKKQGTPQTIYVLTLGLWTLVHFGIVPRRVLAMIGEQSQFATPIAAGFLGLIWTVVYGTILWDRIQEGYRFWDVSGEEDEEGNMMDDDLGVHDIQDADDLSVSDDEVEHDDLLDHDDDDDTLDSWQLDGSSKKKRRSAVALLLDFANTITLRRRSSYSEILNCSQTSFSTNEQELHYDCCDPKVEEPPVAAEDIDPLRNTLSAYKRFRVKKEKSQ